MMGTTGTPTLRQQIETAEVYRDFLAEGGDVHSDTGRKLAREAGYLRRALDDADHGTPTPTVYLNGVPFEDPNPPRNRAERRRRRRERRLRSTGRPRDYHR